MQEIIYDSAPDFWKMIGNGQTGFLRDQKLSLEASDGCWGASLRLRDITHAMQAGQLCPSVHVQFANAVHGDSTGLQAMQHFARPYGSDLRRCLADLLARPWVAQAFGYAQIFEGAVTFSRSDLKGTRVYSPFGTLAPLERIPGKWMLPHVLRALWNGQFDSLKCTGHYTDDYAGDAAEDFRRGLIKDARAFCRQIIESPGGWWANSREGLVSICCHSFDSNSFRPNLARRAPSDDTPEVEAVEAVAAA